MSSVNRSTYQFLNTSRFSGLEAMAIDLNIGVSAHDHGEDDNHDDGHDHDDDHDHHHGITSDQKQSIFEQIFEV